MNEGGIAVAVIVIIVMIVIIGFGMIYHIDAANDKLDNILNLLSNKATPSGRRVP